MLKTHAEIKEYVIQTIKSGNKERIQKVMRRYQQWLKEQKEEQQDLYKTATEIFKDQITT